MSDESVGLEVGWSFKGFSAKIRSRLFSAADRSGGLKLDAAALDTERAVAIHRAVTDTQLALIAASKTAIANEIENDPALARRALAVFSRAERQSENIQASFELAIEDLQNRTDEAALNSDVGPDEINPEFMNRWEAYASNATTEHVREKWGRILSAEIRKPETFNAKLLRVLDEIDSKTAELFEKFAEYRIGLSVPTMLNELTEHEIRDLEQAELVISEGLGYSSQFMKTIRGDETSWYMLIGHDVGIVVRANPLPETVEVGRFVSKPLSMRDDKLSLQVIPFTNIGNALASILPDKQLTACIALAKQIRGADEGAAKVIRREKIGWVDDEQFASDIDETSIQ